MGNSEINNLPFLGDGVLFLENSYSGRPISLYIHIPFCSVRCGYCDFNSYTKSQLGMTQAQDKYVKALLYELHLVAEVLNHPRVQTVFFGGGTPTQLSASHLGIILQAIKDDFILDSGAEITTEANPESIDETYLDELLQYGFNRLSLGMQSNDESVLAVLERKHTPRRALECIRWAKKAGFKHLSLDLIYGTPGESVDSWCSTLEAVLSVPVDHVSAYALILEPGTALARRIRQGLISAPDDDDMADKYLLADIMLSDRGFANYEISNWAKPGAECKHNLAYWHSANWWGVGAGAHSHIQGCRWWNVKHPKTYTEKLKSGSFPVAGWEVLTREQQRVEQVLLKLRLNTGLDISVLTETEQQRLAQILTQEYAVMQAGKLILTRRGRLLADGVVRDLLD